MKSVVFSVLLLAMFGAMAFGESYYKGKGGKGQSIAVLVPEGKGLGKDEAYLPTLAQGVFVGDFSKYSAITVLDRQNLEKVLRETESGIYEAGSDFIELGKITKTSLLLSGSVTKTKTAYTFSITVTDTKSGETKAAYNGSCTIAEFDNFSGIKKASLELLTQMGIQLTDVAKAELSGAAAAQSVKAQTALAQGITAQKNGTEIEALTYYNMAAAFDPSLLEAQSRVSITSASFSGNIGADARNDIKWRNEWVARINQFEVFLDNYLRNNSPGYELLYSTDLLSGAIDYKTETMPLAFYARLIFADYGWFEALTKSIKTIKDGLMATGRAEAWGLDTWPQPASEIKGESRSGVKPFREYKNDFEVVFDILNEKGKVIGTSKTTFSGMIRFAKEKLNVLWRYYLYGGYLIYEGIEKSGFAVGYIENENLNFLIKRLLKDNSIFEVINKEIPVFTIKARTVYAKKEYRSQIQVVYPSVNANDITDKLTIRVTSINGVSAELAAKKGLQITPYNGEVYKPDYQDAKAAISWNDYEFDSNGKIISLPATAVTGRGWVIEIPKTIWGKKTSIADNFIIEYNDNGRLGILFGNKVLGKMKINKKNSTSVYQLKSYTLGTK